VAATSSSTKNSSESVQETLSELSVFLPEKTGHKTRKSSPELGEKNSRRRRRRRLSSLHCLLFLVVTATRDAIPRSTKEDRNHKNLVRKQTSKTSSATTASAALTHIFFIATTTATTIADCQQPGQGKKNEEEDEEQQQKTVNEQRTKQQQEQQKQRRRRRKRTKTTNKTHWKLDRFQRFLDQKMQGKGPDAKDPRASKLPAFRKQPEHAHI
jgi:hypothetical protein